ncbi:MAG: hypothetical protein U1F81_16220 [Verrucomicrobiaceae bacterium]
METHKFRITSKSGDVSIVRDAESLTINGVRIALADLRALTSTSIGSQGVVDTYGETICIETTTQSISIVRYDAKMFWSKAEPNRASSLFQSVSAELTAIVLPHLLANALALINQNGVFEIGPFSLSVEGITLKKMFGSSFCSWDWDIDVAHEHGPAGVFETLHHCIRTIYKITYTSPTSKGPMSFGHIKANDRNSLLLFRIVLFLNKQRCWQMAPENRNVVRESLQKLKSLKPSSLRRSLERVFPEMLT